MITHTCKFCAPGRDGILTDLNSTLVDFPLTQGMYEMHSVVTSISMKYVYCKKFREKKEKKMPTLSYLDT